MTVDSWGNGGGGGEMARALALAVKNDAFGG